MESNKLKKHYTSIITGIAIILFIYILLLKSGIIKVDYFDGKENIGEVLSHMTEDATNLLSETKASIDDSNIVNDTRDEIQSEGSILDKLKESKEVEESTSILDRLRGTTSEEEVESSPNLTISSFAQAKRVLEVAYTGIGERTIFCDCGYDSDGAIDYTDCGYDGEKFENRENSIEWDHILPAAFFGQTFAEWQDPTKFSECVDSDDGDVDSSRVCASNNEEFEFMESDIYNLYPAIGSVNALKSDYTIDDIWGNGNEFGSCDVKIASQEIEPRDEVKGDVARIYMYMQSTYPDHVSFSSSQEKTIDSWNNLDPIDDEECNRYNTLKVFQKNTNPILDSSCN